MPEGQRNEATRRRLSCVHAIGRRRGARASSDDARAHETEDGRSPPLRARAPLVAHVDPRGVVEAEADVERPVLPPEVREGARAHETEDGRSPPLRARAPLVAHVDPRGVVEAEADVERPVLPPEVREGARTRVGHDEKWFG